MWKVNLYKDEGGEGSLHYADVVATDGTVVKRLYPDGRYSSIDFEERVPEDDDVPTEAVQGISDSYILDIMEQALTSGEVGEIEVEVDEMALQMDIFRGRFDRDTLDVSSVEDAGDSDGEDGEVDGEESG